MELTVEMTTISPYKNANKIVGMSVALFLHNSSDKKCNVSLILFEWLMNILNIS